MKRMFLVVTLLIAFVGSSFAQANLYDKIIEKTYNLSVEAIEAAKKAEEEALEAKKAEDDKSGKETAAIKLTNTVDYIVVIQGIHDPKTFMITW